VRVFRPCENHEEGAGDEEVEVCRGADRVHVEASEDGHAGGGGDPPDGRVVADVPSVEEGLWRAWRRGAAAREAA